MTRQEAIETLRGLMYGSYDPDEINALTMAIDALSAPMADDAPPEADYNAHLVRCGECRFRKDGVCELTMAEMPDEFYCKDGRRKE